jgi:hypothetical protein
VSDLNHHIYEVDELVIGNSLEAISYAFLNQKNIVVNEIRKPYFFDFFEEAACLRKYMIEPIEYELTGINGSKIVGASKLEVWKRLIFHLSMAGLIPVADKVYSLRIEDDNLLKITTNNSRMIKIKFDKLRIFDTEKIVEFDTYNNCDKFRIVDWINVRSGMQHEYDYFETKDDFVKEVYFYPSDRMGFGENDNRKDLVAVSYLTKEQLNDFSYSDTYVKFKVLKLMKDAGIKGARNGKRPDDPTKYAYYSIKIEPSAREISIAEKFEHKNGSSFIFDCRKEREIYDSSPECSGYIHKIGNIAS